MSSFKYKEVLQKLTNCNFMQLIKINFKYFIKQLIIFYKYNF